MHSSTCARSMASSAVKYALKNGVAVLHIASPPVNALGAAVRAGLVAGVEHAINVSATGLVVAGSGSTFPAGADITEFGKPHVPPSFADVMAAFEDAPFPTAAAIHGTTLGGGFELAMACHWRAMGVKARVGLPEIHLGLLPGAGGTQRLPRLVGADAALEMMLTGAPITADRALALGAVDVVVPEAEVLQSAVDLVTTHPVRRAHTVVVDGFRDAAKRSAFEEKAKLPAAQAIVCCVDAAVGSALESGLEVEGREFHLLKETPEARALQHLFFAERACAKVPGIDAKGAPQITSAGVVGGGTMGRGIAMCFLDAGLPVTLVDVDADAAEKAAAGIEATYKRSSAFKKGRLSEEALSKKMEMLDVSAIFSTLGEVDIVVEAIYEDLDAKKAVFAILDDVCKPAAVLASNTSTLSIDKIADAVAAPARVVGTHFFSPANVMKLLENVRGARTGDDAVAAAMALGKRLRKTTVLAGDAFGFIGNRMLEPYGRECLALLRHRDVGVADVDRALTGFGMAMGFFAMSDLAGNDIGYAVRTSLGLTDEATRDASVEYSADIADALVEAGRFGQKAGKGWYLYEQGPRVPLPDPVVDALIGRFGDESLVPSVDADAILDRAILALANEGFRVLEEGLALCPSDLDVVWTAGYGFPRHKGGPMQWAEERGLRSCVATLEGLAAERPDVPYLKPSALLVALADADAPLADWEKYV